MLLSLVGRLASVAIGSALLIVGLAEIVGGRWWGFLAIVGAAGVLLGVALEASGIVRVPRRGDRRSQVVAATTAEMSASRSVPSSAGPGSALRSRTALK